MTEELRFGRFVVRPDQRVLLADGRPVPLGSRAFDVLLALLEARGALLTRDALIARVWPDVVVEEGNLHTQISVLRRAFGPEGAALIVTDPGRGYRFAATVGPAPAPAQPTPTVAPLTFPGLPEGAPVLHLPPVEAIGEAEADRRFADAIGADLAVALGRLAWFAVVGGRAAPANANPTHAVRAHLRRDTGGAARLSVELTVGTPPVLLWGGRFDAPAGASAFDQQDALVGAVVGGLQPAFMRADIERVLALPGDAVFTEHDAARRAIALLQRGRHADIQAAIALMDAALSRHPDSARLLSIAAYGRCRLLSQRAATPPPPGAPSYRDQALALAEAAVARAADMAPVLVRVANVFGYLQHREPFARAMAERAIALAPHSSWLQTMAGWALLYCDATEAAAATLAEAVRLDPVDTRAGYALAGLSFAELILGRLEAAVESARRAVAVAPDQLTAHRALVAALGMAGRPATAEVAALLARDPGFTIENYLTDRELPDLERPLFVQTKEGMRRAGVPERAPPRPTRAPHLTVVEGQTARRR